MSQKSALQPHRSHTKLKKLLFAIGVCLLTFVMMSMFIYGDLFVSDEEEIFNKGQALAQGKLLYTDIGSQHMPLMYYFAAAFSLFGAVTVMDFRLWFYALFALIWGLIAYRYSDRFGKGILLLTPMIFFSVLPTIRYGTAILSEQAQALGYIILALELLQFRTDKPLSIGSCVMISLAIFLSFGSAFISIFVVFAVGVTVAVQELWACFREKRGIVGSIQHLFMRYWKLVLIVALPFVALIGYYVAVGSLGDFIGWAYSINRVIYPKYLDGYGSSVFVSLFGGVINLVQPITDLSFDHTALLYVALLALAAVGIGYVHRFSANGILVGGILFMVLTAATRAAFEFHGVPVIALLSLLAAFAAVRALRHVQPKKDGDVHYVKRALCLFCAVILVTPFLNTFSATISHSDEEYLENEISPLSKTVDTLTERGESVGFSMLNYEVLISSGTIPATSTAGSCPWFWEYAGAEVMEELQSNPPRVFLCDRNLITWDYAIISYAPELIQFLDDNYQSMAPYGHGSLYIHNDYYEQALVLLGIQE